MYLHSTYPPQKKQTFAIGLLDIDRIRTEIKDDRLNADVNVTIVGITKQCCCRYVVKFTLMDHFFFKKKKTLQRVLSTAK